MKTISSSSTDSHWHEMQIRYTDLRTTDRKKIETWLPRAFHPRIDIFNSSDSTDLAKQVSSQYACNMEIQHAKNIKLHVGHFR